MDPALDPPLTRCWSAWHDRLHRELLQHPQRLPPGQRLLLAVSGGQDSMALTALLLGLQRLHHWELQLWHGDHNWHAGSAVIAAELRAWSLKQGLPITIDRNNSIASTGQTTGSEAEARRWRYQQLATCAAAQECRVVCGHTATDKAETLLLHLTRGTDLAGLGSMRRERVLEETQHPEVHLVRPLLGFSRQDTASICRDLNLPIWLDPSNANLRFSRNRIRQQVLPVLNELHPGCEKRIAALSERLSQVQDSQQILLTLSLEALSHDHGLHRQRFAALPHALRRDLLARWLQLCCAPPLKASLLEELAQATGEGDPSGGRDLPSGWRLHWDEISLQLKQRQ
ncbi:MAG: tRNA lysidine(34) synthetase TilS [Synechococcus sp.]